MSISLLKDPYIAVWGRRWYNSFAPRRLGCQAKAKNVDVEESEEAEVDAQIVPFKDDKKEASEAEVVQGQLK